MDCYTFEKGRVKVISEVNRKCCYFFIVLRIINICWFNYIHKY